MVTREWIGGSGGDASGTGADWNISGFTSAIRWPAGTTLLRTRMFLSLNCYVTQTDLAPVLQWDPTWWAQGGSQIRIGIAPVSTDSDDYHGVYPTDSDTFPHIFSIYQPCSPKIQTEVFTEESGLHQVVQFGPGPDVVTQSFGKFSNAPDHDGRIFITWSTDDSFGFFDLGAEAAFTAQLAGLIQIYCLFEALG